MPIIQLFKDMSGTNISASALMLFNHKKGGGGALSCFVL